MRQASFKCETPRLELKSWQTFLAIKRCQRTKIRKVIKLARSSKKKWLQIRAIAVKLLRDASPPYHPPSQPHIMMAACPPYCPTPSPTTTLHSPLYLLNGRGEIYGTGAYSETTGGQNGRQCSLQTKKMQNEDVECRLEVLEGSRQATGSSGSANQWAFFV